MFYTETLGFSITYESNFYLFYIYLIIKPSKIQYLEGFYVLDFSLKDIFT
jgi:hypothetical protein